MSDSRYELGSSREPSGLELHPKPRTTRLNRNAWIAIILLGVGVLLAAALTLHQNRNPIHPPSPAAMAGAGGADPFWEKHEDGLALPDVTAPPPPPSAPTPGEVNAIPVAADALSDDERLRRERIRRAVGSSGLVSTFQTVSKTAAPRVLPNGQVARKESPALNPFDALTKALEAPDPTLLQNNQAAKQAFLDSAGAGETEETNRHLVREPISEFEVTAGMVIPAVLITQGDSDLPGMMTGRVRENVYDSATGRNLLVPQGTTIVGIYDSVVTFGQRRLLVAWQRLIFPDGTKLNIGSMPGVDLVGASGFQDIVDHHYKRVFGGALLLSAITAGVTLSQNDDRDPGLGSERSTSDRVSDTLATALGQNLGEVATEMIRRQMNVQPTIKIRPGYRFNVFVAKDLIFEEPYLNTFVGGGLIPRG